MSSDEDSVHQNREKFVVERSTEPQPEAANPDFFGPALPLHMLRKQASENEEQIKQIYGPILPDYLQERKKVEDIKTCPEEAKEKPLIGPDLLEYLKRRHSESLEEESEFSGELDEGFGPSTDLMVTEAAGDYYTCISSRNYAKKDESGPSVQQREEWMTELPAKNRAGVGLFARQFKTRLTTDKESDSSVWTETPADKNKKDKTKDHKAILEMNRLKERDKEMEKLVKKAEEKLRKKESLLEMHVKKKKKKKKKEAKEKNCAPPERRPFDRDIDLQIRRFDESKRRAILSKNQFLSDRFAPGQSKFL